LIEGGREAYLWIEPAGRGGDQFDRDWRLVRRVRIVQRFRIGIDLLDQRGIQRPEVRAAGVGVNI